jgi:hypothetical protein
MKSRIGKFGFFPSKKIFQIFFAVCFASQQQVLKIHHIVHNNKNEKHPVITHANAIGTFESF